MNITLKRLMKSRTLRFSLALAVFGAIEVNDSLLAPLFGEKAFGLFCVVISVIVAVLRLQTTTALFTGNDSEPRDSKTRADD